MPKFNHKRGAGHGRCCLCGRKGGGILHGKFGLCRKCWRDGMQETLTPCPSCVRRGRWVAMDDDEIAVGHCRKCKK